MGHSKSYIILLILCLLSLQSKAQTTASDSIASPLPYPAILTDMTHVRLVQDSALTLLMQEKIEGVVHGTVEMPGFRVQIYSSNEHGLAKNEALQVKEQVEQVITQPVYILSNPPFIKVRIGDFLTQEEAMAFKQELLQHFPERAGEIYVVRDEHIRVRR